MNKEALRLYSQGIAELRRFSAISAKDHLAKSISLDPQNPLEHAAMAVAWSALGYDARAKDEAKLALDFSNGLDRESQLLAQARYFELSSDWTSAINACRQLVESYPDNLDYRLQLADLQTSDAVPKEALRTLSEVQQLPPASRADARIDIARSKAEEALGDFSQMESAANLAIGKGKEQNARLLVAKALDLKGVAVWRLGDPNGGASSLQDAKTIYLTEGDTNGVATELVGLAQIARGKGDFDSAIDLYQRALTNYQESSNKRGAIKSINGIGLIEYEQGQLESARKTFEEEVALAQEVSDKRSEANAQGNLGLVANDSGQLPLAEKYHEQAISNYREMGDKAHLANELNSLGALLFDEGELEQARQIELEALPMAREIQDKVKEAYILSATGEILTQMGELEQARTDHEAALKIWKQVGRTLDAAYDSASLARLLAEQGHPQEAEQPLRAAVAIFEKEQETDYLLITSSYLIDVLLLEQKVAEAKNEAARDTQLAAKAQLPISQLDALISVAMVDAEIGNRAKALHDLRLILDKARKSSFVRLELEARYAIGSVESKSNPTLAKVDLDRLATDANTKGFHFIQNKALRALSTNGRRV